jgi:hypothetical protein
VRKRTTAEVTTGEAELSSEKIANVAISMSAAVRATRMATSPDLRSAGASEACDY